MVNLETHDIILASAGGALIGLAAVLLMWFNGRVAGISGILQQSFATGALSSPWRPAFIIGLVLGGLIWQGTTGIALMERTDFPVWLTILAGLLVGFGTSLGSGCTSGHGICGISRLSPRSMVATGVFVLTGMLVASTLARALP
jgi:uncharacterized membrane protein YedE/YeeE